MSSETHTIRSESAQQTMALGEAIATLAQRGDVIALDGELGSGKTQFVRGLTQGMGLDPQQVSSPTFVLMHEYAPGSPATPPNMDTPGEHANVLIHMDAYRMSGSDELDALGWDELRSGGAVIAIEWATRVQETIDEDRLEVFIEHAGEHKRLISFTAHGSWQNRDNQLTITPCPVCKTPAIPAMPSYPFCNMHCRTIDLGRWFNEDYRISRPLEQRDIEAGE